QVDQLRLLGIGRHGLGIVGHDDAVVGQLGLVEREAVVLLVVLERRLAYRVLALVRDLVVAGVALVVGVVRDAHLLVEDAVHEQTRLLVGDEPLERGMVGVDLVDRVAGGVALQLVVGAGDQLLGV